MPTFEFNNPHVNLPERFVDRIRNQFPEDADEFLSALQHPPANSLRMHSTKLTEPPSNLPIPWCEMGYYLPERPAYSLDPLFHAGAYYVQESSSMILGHIFKTLRKETSPWHVLDLCAAPGGKSTHLLDCMLPEDVLVANEIIPMRNAILQENIAKWGHPNVLISRSDPAHFSKINHQFDFIWVDAPCSGEGMFRKDPDTIKEWSLENLQTCSYRQNRILHDIWPSLKPGGFLVYSTCTFNPEENEILLQNFVNEMGAQTLAIPVPDEWGILATTKDTVHYLQFLPHKTHGEGFFVTVIQKPGEWMPNPPMTASKPINKEVLPHLSILKSTYGPYHWLVYENELMAQTLRSQWLFESLQKHLFFTRYALNVGKIIRQELLPSQELAWSIAFQKAAYPICELSKEEALEYLRKSSTLHFKSENGWVLVQYKGVPLGWVKQLGNRINNYYPAPYRLRMQS
jgi:16S rRNA C967 or C1407 C5-methylase (RsmB/RsmF family)/NOL1/NOP2/fmu family ribosome biogenesis protein